MTRREIDIEQHAAMLRVIAKTMKREKGYTRRKELKEAFRRLLIDKIKIVRAGRFSKLMTCQKK